MTDLKKALGANIKRFRKNKKMTQEILAEKIGMEVKSLSRIESGYNYPQYENLISIARVLNIEPWELYYTDNSISIDKMKKEITKSLSSEKVVKSLYTHLKSIEY